MMRTTEMTRENPTDDRIDLMSNLPLSLLFAFLMISTMSPAIDVG